MAQSLLGPGGCRMPAEGAPWRKSSWSSYNGNCVEVAEVGAGWIGVRDSKDARLGPVLVFTEAAWRSFLDEVMNGA